MSISNVTESAILALVFRAEAWAAYSDAPTYGFRALNLGELFQAKCHFSTFQTQPGSASRRCRRILPFVLLL
jgi:hypothetical protein